MQEEKFTFEQINAHIESANLEAYADVKSLTSASASNQLCGIYKIVRPILVAVSNLPILPKKWRGVIKTFVSVLDAICP